MMPLPQARQLVAEQPALTPVTSPLSEAVGRVLAGPVAARLPIPHAATSAMDGWALAGPQPAEGWRMIGPSASGPSQLLPDLQTGEAIEVVTGSALPAGTTSVLRTEHGHSQLAADTHRLRATAQTPDLQPGRNIRPVGIEAVEGELLLTAGEILTPLRVAAAAGAGHDTLPVHPAPQVLMITTGTEVIASGLPAPGQVRDSFTMTLPALLHTMGAGDTTVAKNNDDAAALAKQLTAAEADLVVTVGGTAHSPADPLRPALQQIGADVLIEAVDMRPGHPALVAQLPAGGYLVGLPGNPLAGYAALIALGQPLIDGLRGIKDPCRARVRYYTAAEALPSARRGRRLVPVITDPDGIRSTGYASPHMMRGLAHARALAMVAPEGAAAGAMVSCLPIPTQETALWAD